jgi:hypothetical protein
MKIMVGFRFYRNDTIPMKSTHRGHCQFCGRLQMLPSGVLAKHGYTILGGFFSGVCRGSAHSPFEVSCDQLPIYIDEAARTLSSVEEFQESLRRPVTENKAWFRTEHRNVRRGSWSPSTYRWALCSVRVETIPYRDGDGSYKKFYRDGDTKLEKDTQERVAFEPEISASYSATLEDVCNHANEVYADYLEHEAVSLRRYIDWQKNRVSAWKAAELLPVDAKDKEGFIPTKAPY